MSDNPKKVDIQEELQNKLQEFKNKLKIQAQGGSGSVPTSDFEKEIFGEFGPPVSVREFIESPKYFGNSITQMVRPWVIDLLEEIFSGEYHAPKYQTIVVMAGKGSGKSYLSSLAMCYLWYWLLSFKSFTKYLATKGSQFDDTAQIGIVGMAKHRDQVKHVFFDTVGKFINKTQIFRDRGWLPEKKVTSELRYVERDPITGKDFAKLAILPGNSSETFALGYHIFGAVIDESEFFAEKNRDPVEAIYGELNRRRFSRFKNNGMIMMISSATVDGTFTTSFEAKALKDPTILFRRLSTYDCDPMYEGKERFEYKTKREKGDGTVIDVILHPPLELKHFYDDNPLDALRDIDAIPAVAGKPFFADFMLLMSKINKGRTDPCPDLGKDVAEGPNEIAELLKNNKDFRGIKGAGYRIHCDLAKGSMVQGQCGCGFAMTHKIADADLGFKIVLDLGIRFKAPSNKEIQIPEVLDLILFLKNDLGFGIELVTFDEYQSVMAMQIINGWGNGVKAEKLSVDIKHYGMLKTLIYSGQFDMFEDSNLLYELKRIEDFGSTIDHASGAFKDEADAVVGAAFSATSLETADEVKEVVRPRVAQGIVIPRAGGQIANPQNRGGGSGANYRNQNYIPKYRQ